MTAADVISLSAADLRSAYSAGTLSPREVSASFLARISDIDTSVNAFCWVDPDETLSQAAAAEARYRSGTPLGPLDGVPVAVKDTLLTRGWPTLRGSKAIDPVQPWLHDSPAVRRLREQGAVIIGKTTTSEFGWKAVTDSPLTGISRNPWNTRMSPGGSSGGSAAAIASAMTPLALGTDGGGSIRIPSSFCGVVGIKPTFGRVPQWPGSPFGVLSHLGSMAWTVADAAVLLAAISGPDPLDPWSRSIPGGGGSPSTAGDLSGVRIALSVDLGYVAVQPDIADAVCSAARVMEALGAIVTEADPGFADPVRDFEILWNVGAARAVRPYGARQRAEMDPGLAEIAAVGADVTALDYLAALDARSELTELANTFFATYDLLITPTMPIAAFAAGQEVPDGWPGRRWTSWTPFTYPFNLSGNPAASVPCGFAASGLPIGVQIIAARDADWLVISAAHAYQEAASLTDRRPVLRGGTAEISREAD